jgi:hypothetical protein
MFCQKFPVAREFDGQIELVNSAIEGRTWFFWRFEYFSV